MDITLKLNSMHICFGQEMTELDWRRQALFVLNRSSFLTLKIDKTLCWWD